MVVVVLRVNLARVPAAPDPLHLERAPLLRLDLSPRSPAAERRLDRNGAPLLQHLLLLLLQGRAGAPAAVRSLDRPAPKPRRRSAFKKDTKIRDGFLCRTLRSALRGSGSGQRCPWRGAARRPRPAPPAASPPAPPAPPLLLRPRPPPLPRPPSRRLRKFAQRTIREGLDPKVSRGWAAYDPAAPAEKGPACAASIRTGRPRGKLRTPPSPSALSTAAERRRDQSSLRCW